MKVVLDPGAYMPEYAHYTDAGADLRSQVDMVIGPHDSATIDTGVHVEIPSAMVGMRKANAKPTALHVAAKATLQCAGLDVVYLISPFPGKR